MYKRQEYIIQFVENYGGIAYTNQKQKEYAKKAIESLNTYEDSDVKEALINFVEFVISRTK